MPNLPAQPRRHPGLAFVNHTAFPVADLLLVLALHVALSRLARRAMLVGTGFIISW